MWFVELGILFVLVIAVTILDGIRTELSNLNIQNTRNNQKIAYKIGRVVDRLDNR